MITVMATERAFQGNRPPLYVDEHMTDKDVADATAAKKMKVNRSTIGKWRKKGTQIRVDELIRLAKAIGLDDWRDFLHPPGQQSLDAIVDGTPPNVRAAIVDFAKRLKTD